MQRFFFCLFTILGLLSCSGPEQANNEPDPVVFHRGNGAEPDTLDPHRSEETSSAEILRDLFEGLTTETVDSQVTPGVAERWTISDDGTVYTFYLRADARWSNGDPVTAEDFVFAFRRTLDPATASTYAQTLYPIKNAKAVNTGEAEPATLGVVATDPNTLEVTLRAPTPYFLQLLTHSSAFPIHRPSVAEFGDGFTQPGRLISNGAYVLNEWLVQSHIKIVRNNYYWDRDNVQIDQVYYYPTEDIDAEFKRYRAGELDITRQIPNSQFKWIRDNLGSQLEVDPYLSVYYYVFDLSEPPFNDVRLRQALTMAIDREILAEKVTGVGEVPAYSLVPNGVNDYGVQRYGWAELPHTERVAAARELYHAAGYSDNQPLQVQIHYNTSDNHKKIAVAIAAMWKEALGVQSKLLNEEWKVLLQTRKNRANWEIMRYGWVGDFNDAYTFLEIMHSQHGQNTAGYNNPQYDRLTEAASEEGDLTARRKLMESAERVFMEDYPILPLYFYVSKHLVQPYVQGFRPNIMDHNYSRHYRIEERPPN
ncbi:MAG: peptide ABC transporter substrate-binding protein [Gammaproteobacteria bacterium]